MNTKMKAMLSVEDVQDAIAAEKAGEETKADAIEFDENLTGGDPIDDRNVETPSEQYLELINSVCIIWGLSRSVTF